MKEKKNKAEGEIVAPEERTAQVRKKKSVEGKKETSKPNPADLKREKVTVFATLDESMVKAIESAADDCGHTLVRLEERVIDDYIAAKTAPTPEQTEVKRVEDFVSDANNRAKAANDAKRLYSFLTKDPIESYRGKVFTRRDIVKSTTLSNSQSVAMLTMLDTFGFIKFTGGKMVEFEFCFHPADVCALVRRQAVALFTECAKDFVRYKSALEANDGLTKEQRKAEIASLKAEFKKLLS